MRTLCTLALAAAALLAPGQAAADYFPYVTKGPVILGVTHDEAWVTWYTAHHQGESSLGNTCQIDALTGTPNDTIPTLTLTPPAGATTIFTAPECDRYHSVHLTGLAPGTSYTFSLDKPYDDQSQALGSFVTAPAPGSTASFRFFVYGDVRDNSVVQSSTRSDHQGLVDAMVAAPGPPAFMIHTGDFALNLPAVSGDDRGYTEFFEVERRLLARAPLVPVMGNHESIDTAFFDGLLSAPTLAGSTHPYFYSFDWGQVHVAVLDTFEGPTDILEGGARSPMVTSGQIAWLAGDLATARQAGRMIFVVAHQGPYSYGADSNAHGGLADVRDQVVPLMVENGALAIFAGHDHYYERGHEGCVDFFVVGGGGAESYAPDPGAPSVAVASTGVPTYMVVTVTGASAAAEVRDSAGGLVDQFTFSPATCTPAADGGVADGGGASDGGGAATDAGRADGTARDGTAGDGGATAAPPAGCGCRAAGRAGGAPVVLALVLGALLAPAAARRRHRRRP